MIQKEVFYSNFFIYFDFLYLFYFFYFSSKEKKKYKILFFLSKETSILINNWFMMYFLSVVLIGTIYPIFLDVISSQKISVGPPFYNKLIIPFLIPFLLSLWQLDQN